METMFGLVQAKDEYTAVKTREKPGKHTTPLLEVQQTLHQLPFATRCMESL